MKIILNNGSCILEPGASKKCQFLISPKRVSSYRGICRFSHIRKLQCLILQYLLSMPPARSKTLGDRAFMVAAPRLWNSLPIELRAITNVNSFKAHIKTYLFKTLY